jgi:hypothetical protein
MAIGGDQRWSAAEAAQPRCAVMMRNAAFHHTNGHAGEADVSEIHRTNLTH